MSEHRFGAIISQDETGYEIICVSDSGPGVQCAEEGAVVLSAGKAAAFTLAELNAVAFAHIARNERARPIEVPGRLVEVEPTFVLHETHTSGGLGGFVVLALTSIVFGIVGAILADLFNII